MSYASLVTPGVSDVIVRRWQEDGGSGFDQEGMIIFAWGPEGPRVIFDEPSKLVFAIPTNNGGKTDQSEDSSFSIDADDRTGDEHSAAKMITQRQSIRDHGVSIVRFWDYYWDPELGLFQKYQTSN